MQPSNTIRQITASLLCILLVTGCATAPHSQPSQAEKDLLDPIGSLPLPAVELTPTLLYQLLVAEIAGQRRHYNVAAEGYLRAAHETKDPRIIMRAARIASFAGIASKAIEASELWLTLDPEAVEAYTIMASASLQENDPTSTLKHLQKIAELLKDDPLLAYRQISTVLSRHKDNKSSLLLINTLVEADPNNPYALYTQVQLAMRTGNLQLAESSIKKTLELRDDWGAAVVLYARILHMQKKYDDALTLLELHLDGGNLKDEYDVRLTYARMLVDAKQANEAYRQFSQLQKQSPDNADIVYALGLISIQLQAMQQAEQHFSKLLTLDKHGPEAAYFLGQIAESRGELEIAIRWYESVKGGEYYLTSQLRIIQLLREQQAIDQALLYLKSVTPRDRKEKVQLAITENNLLQELDRNEQAMELLTHALEEEPNESSLLYARALLAEKLDRLQLAESDLRLILEREPENAHALNALGFTLADRTKRFKEAKELIQRALDISPNEPAILDSMGWALYRMGELDEAISYLRKALSLSNDPEIAAHLGEVLWKKGEKAQAQSIWNSALEENPDHPYLLETINKFNP